MIRYAALSSSGKRYKSDSRDDVDRWCAERVKAGEECEVYARKTAHGGITRGTPERVGIWLPPIESDPRTALDLLESAGRYEAAGD
jgi:hypothetical protein